MNRQAQPGDPPWWSDPGPDLCNFCLQTFHVEVGYHCADCDQPVCPVCVVHVHERRTVICPDCGEDG